MNQINTIGHTARSGAATALFLSLSNIALAVNAGTFGLVPGDIYAVVQGGVEQYDPTLHPVATLAVPNATVTEGIAFTPSGNMVLSAFYGNPGGSGTAHELEFNSTGSILHDLDLGLPGLDRASDAAVDSQDRTYAASVAGIVDVAPDFSSFQILPYTFVRASGVAIGPDNRLYVSDQAANSLVIFDQNRQAETSFPLGAVPTGLGFDSKGQLFAASFFDGTLLSVNVPAQDSAVFLSGLPGISDVKFAQDDSYYISLNRGNTLDHFSASNQLLNSTTTGNFSDSIAIFPIQVPEPAAWIMALLGLLAAVSIRRYRG